MGNPAEENDLLPESAMKMTRNGQRVNGNFVRNVSDAPGDASGFDGRRQPCRPGQPDGQNPAARIFALVISNVLMQFLRASDAKTG